MIGLSLFALNNRIFRKGSISISSDDHFPASAVSLSFSTLNWKFNSAAFSNISSSSLENNTLSERNMFEIIWSDTHGGHEYIDKCSHLIPCLMNLYYIIRDLSYDSWAAVLLFFKMSSKIYCTIASPKEDYNLDEQHIVIRVLVAEDKILWRVLQQYGNNRTNCAKSTSELIGFISGETSVVDEPWSERPFEVSGPLLGRGLLALLIITIELLVAKLRVGSGQNILQNHLNYRKPYAR